MECDVVEEERGAKRANVIGQCKAVNMQQTAIDAIDIVRVLHVITSRITRIVRVGKIMRGGKVLLKARPNSAGPTAETLWAMTTVFQPSCAGRSDRGC